MPPANATPSAAALHAFYAKSSNVFNWTLHLPAPPATVRRRPPQPFAFRLSFGFPTHILPDIAIYLRYSALRQSPSFSAC